MDLRAVLVDDEQLTRDELGYLLGQIGGVEVVGQAGNGVEALSVIGRLHPDLVFLDVQMPGLTGFQVARRMLDGEAPPHIVFVTAYDQHAIEAFEVNAVDYLLKPVEPSRLELAVQRARRRMDGDKAGERSAAAPVNGDAPDGASTVAGLNDAQIERIVQIVAERQSRRERLAIRVGERFLLVQAEEILFASLADDGITVVTSQHTGMSNYRTLDELHSKLDPDVFWRVHRSHLVNINKIKEIVPWFSRNYILRMKDEKSTEIPVSRTQTRRLREYLETVAASASEIASEGLPDPLAVPAEEEVSIPPQESIPVPPASVTSSPAPTAAPGPDPASLRLAQVKEELTAWFKTLVSAAVYAVLIVTFGFQVARVEGQSMSHTLEDQDRLIVDKLVYRIAEPRRGDIVMLYYPVDPSKSFVKRVIAEEGDTVRIVDGRVYVNDVPLKDDYVSSEYRSHEDWGPQLIPEGYDFVMGDHRNNSSDSRTWGMVPKKYIIGKVRLRWWPVPTARVF